MTDHYKALVCELHNLSVVPGDLFARASRAIDSLTAPGRDDFARYQAAGVAVKAERYAYEAASVRLELAQLRERIAEINSQAQPLGDLDIDREKVRQVLTYVVCGRLKP